MSKKFNGRFFSESLDEPSDDPDKDFPIVETVSDHSGAPRRFTIELHRVGIGFSVRAREDTGNEIGYEFGAFDCTSPYLALGKLRQKMRRALTTRHLVWSAHGADQTMLHDRLVGHIGWSGDADGIVFVVDGIPLTLEDIERIASMHEGWQFPRASPIRPAICSDWATVAAGPRIAAWLTCAMLGSFAVAAGCHPD